MGPDGAWLMIFHPLANFLVGIADATIAKPAMRHLVFMGIRTLELFTG
jgi:hypothetical protein